MKAIQEVFERYEKKYMLTAPQYAALCDALEPFLERDAYGRHTICNLYYDTQRYDLIRASLERPVYKEKLRLRSYGVPTQASTVFLELKKKYKGVVYKRRAPVSLPEAAAYLGGGPLPANTQILREIDWFRQRYETAAKVLIAYDRVALFGRANAEVRVTFDSRLRWRTAALELSAGDWGAPLLGAGMVLMEAKLPGAMPLWLSHALDELGIRQTSFSKYGACYQQHLWQQPTTKGGIICA